MKKYEPLEDRVLIRPHKQAEGQTTEGGIITDTMKRETQEATVVSVGNGVFARETGVFMPTILCPGDLVLIPNEYGMPIDTDEEKGLRLVREGDIIMRLKKFSDNQENN